MTQEPLSNEELKRLEVEYECDILWAADPDDVKILLAEVNRLQGIEAQRDEFLRLSNERYEKIQQLQQEKLDYQAHMLANLRKSDRLKDHYQKALRRIVCLNISMPDEVFNLANDAIEGAESND